MASHSALPSRVESQDLSDMYAAYFQGADETELDSDALLDPERVLQELEQDGEGGQDYGQELLTDGEV